MLHIRNRWTLPLALVSALTLSACEDVSDPEEEEPDIATMRIVVGSGGSAQTVNVARTGCTATGGPITLAQNVTTPVTISFLNAAGQPDANASDATIFRVAGATSGTTTAAEPAPTPGTITWARTGNFAGTLRGTAVTTSGSVTFSAFHIEEGHPDFECAVAITVQ
jgi:hypothetical protein